MNPPIGRPGLKSTRVARAGVAPRSLSRKVRIMETNKTTTSKSIPPTGCCPPFDPTAFSAGEVTWRDKPFVADHAVSLFHIPLNMGRKVLRNQRLIDAAAAAPSQPLMLTEEKSPWGTDVYIDVTRPVPGAKMTTLSGTFLTRVYEGPYSQAGKWAEDMRRYVASKGKKAEKIFFSYTTCPRCARAYGKNYVVLFAQVPEGSATPARPEATAS